METAEAVLRFLAGVGPGSEAEYYLRLFRARPRESFAAIVIDPQTWRENTQGVVLDLRLLSSLSLTPVVVLGFYQPQRADEFASVLAEKLAAVQVKGRVLGATSSREAVAAAAAGGEIPILPLNEANEDARELALARILSSLATRKLIFLRDEGGLRTGDRPLSVINLGDEFTQLMALPSWSADQRRLLACAHRLVLERVEHELLVTLTSPISLLHELFTVKGAGTLLRRGAQIVRHAGYEGVELGRLRSLLESSFGKTPREALLTRPLEHAYVEARYRGAALVARTRLGSYLSKFAVTREAQGEGIGRDLWQAMQADHRVLFWRARAENPVRSWYERQCDGRVRVGEWAVYFVGLAPERIPEAIGYALSQPLDF